MNTTTTPSWLSGRYISDGGLETGLIYDYDVELPEFAAFPLLDDEEGRSVLRRYYDSYAAVARQFSTGLTLETPTWRANPNWGAKLDYDNAALDRVNRAAVRLLDEFRDTYTDLSDVRIIGTIGPRGDGYVPGERVDPDTAAEYHRGQIEAFAAAGVDVVAAYTLTGAEEGLGIARAARESDIPALIGFTVETDGRLPDGTALRAAVELVDEYESPAGFIVNCAHPTHVASGIEEGSWLARILQVSPNASMLTHAELDRATELDAGDRGHLSSSFSSLQAHLPNLAVVGGCCGTGPGHVAALWSAAEGHDTRA
ncbi:MAG: homocysteine S-methyltransferase [Leifsonia sp.]|nr:homocysteine S-methyltransferase [Leifsonia sp.]HBS74464.1 homocysteine S-methyltransferase [Microbacterium sp.]|tara:strand:- start:6494 stop:7432 length:939 start_codon:yes stop_codon:yes gene_type:complete